MYITRKIDAYLDEWYKNEDRLPLIIKGARQVGKTESVRRFANIHYKNFIEINFIEDNRYKMIIDDGFSPENIIKNISLINNNFNFEPRQTLIFFDEIQAFPNITTSLKFFKIDGRFDVICSGSFLGINYKQIDSISVGYKTDYEMKSIDFEEFLWAKGYSPKMIDDLYSHLKNLQPFSETEITVYNNLFMDYCILGGMPAVVARYIENKNFSGINDIQNQIILDYKADIRKYLEGLDQTRVMNVFNYIPVGLGKDNKKFQISKVAHGARSKNYIGAIEWLEDAGLIHVCYCLNFPELPLKGNYMGNNYKIYFCDTGLLLSLLDDEVKMDFKLNKNLGTYKGALYENLVAEALVKNGFGLYFYKRENSTLEEDFFVRTINHLIPVEVKAGNTKSKALRELINNNKYNDIQWGIKVAQSNLGFESNILTIPTFTIFLLRRYLNDLNQNNVKLELK